MTDIKQIYTSHQSLVGTVTPSVIRTVKWNSPYNFVCYSSNQRLALACIFVYYVRMTSSQPVQITTIKIDYTQLPWIAGSSRNHMICNCPTTSQETFNDGYNSHYLKKSYY